MTNDSISDMLTRIRNASMVNKPEVVMPYSRVKHMIANILHDNGYLGKVTKVETADQPEHSSSSFAHLRIGLRYNAEGAPVIKNLKRVSKPGLRIYRGKDRLPVVLNNLGIAIISTSQGMMTNSDARKKGLGGEVVCEVY